MASRRLLQELKTHAKDLSSDSVSHLGPVSSDNLFHWTAVLHGPENTAYESGKWKLDIRIPETYPISPPAITFVTPICHPNVHFKTGEICLDLLKTNWSAAYTIEMTLNAISQLLGCAEAESPLNVDIAQLVRIGDEEGASSLIRYYTRVYRWEG